jgi:hypothetical protein
MFGARLREFPVQQKHLRQRAFTLRKAYIDLNLETTSGQVYGTKLLTSDVDHERMPGEHLAAASPTPVSQCQQKPRDPPTAMSNYSAAVPQNLL